jgi:hypothetical protein
MAILFDVLCEGYIAKMSVKKDNTPNPLVRNIQSRLHFGSIIWAQSQLMRFP